MSRRTEYRYRLPESCCANCDHSYQNEYGDCQCGILDPGNVIDFGGFCDKYTKAVIQLVEPEQIAVVIPQPEIKERLIVRRDCNDCIYVLGDNLCALIGKQKEGCRKWEQKTELPFEGSDVSIDDIAPVTDNDIAFDDFEIDPTHNCLTCFYSCYHENDEPWCNLTDETLIGINLDGPCDAWSEDGVTGPEDEDNDEAYVSVEPEGCDCETCEKSAFVDGVPKCTLYGHEITDEREPDCFGYKKDASCG